jgi:hypothetical protein
MPRKGAQDPKVIPANTVPGVDRLLQVTYDNSSVVTWDTCGQAIILLHSITYKNDKLGDILVQAGNLYRFDVTTKKDKEPVDRQLLVWGIEAYKDSRKYVHVIAYFRTYLRVFAAYIDLCSGILYLAGRYWT